jgi:hypothetical protein
VRLPDHLEPPATITVCEVCSRACCWQGVNVCGGASRPNRQSITLTGEQAAEMALEHVSFWHPPKKADDGPRSVEELLDFVQYVHDREMVKDRSFFRQVLVRGLGIDADQVDAALDQAWPVRRAS